ncbi:lipoyl synthase [candidate division WOR-3 bacterium]|nr:lipoyl synthase [candidate division WOR-3 bacterium]
MRTRKPAWLRTAVPAGDVFEHVNRRLRDSGLCTVCTSARCPNLAECWNRGTATVMLLGEVCTRACRFCSVCTGNPRGAVDEDEPARVARAVRELGLRYVVLTSVDRDDLPDHGAAQFARTVVEVRSQKPEVRDQNADRMSEIRVEVLTPDFGGREELIGRVVDARPDVFGHNLETVERLSPAARDRRASYRRSLGVLETVKRLDPGMLTKSGLMVGLGERDEEVSQALEHLRSTGCDIVTIGQYLQPSRRCLPVERYVEPERFEQWQAEARGLGFRSAFCGPLVRSSYLADRLFAEGIGGRIGS